jgi:hypothetical protein
MATELVALVPEMVVVPSIRVRVRANLQNACRSCGCRHPARRALYVPLLDEDDPRDARMLHEFLAAFGGMDFDASRTLLAVRTARAVARRPSVLWAAVGWARRAVARAGGLRELRAAPPRPITFVMHSFMDARVVRPAWNALQGGEVATDPEIREARERLQACSYAMAHPEDGTLVPACVQHAVLDPAENARLAELLPIRTTA